MGTSFMLGLPFQLSSKQAFASFTTFCNCFSEYSKGNTFSRKKIGQILRTWTCLLLIYNNWFLHLPKLSSGLPTTMVLLPRTENDNTTQGMKLLLLYTKDNNGNNKRL